jgi:hypothetical protein
MLKLSAQAQGAIMMALQKGILEQADITDLLGEFKFKINEEEQLFVLNPPIVKYGVEKIKASEEDA